MLYNTLMKSEFKPMQTVAYLQGDNLVPVRILGVHENGYKVQFILSGDTLDVAESDLINILKTIHTHGWN